MADERDSKRDKGGQLWEDRGGIVDEGIYVYRDERRVDEREEKWLSDARASSRFSRHVEMRLDDDDD